MVKKGISVLVIFVITIAFGIFEIVQVNKTLITLEDLVNDLYIKYELNSDKIDEHYNETGDVREFWDKAQKWLCFIFNHIWLCYGV